MNADLQHDETRLPEVLDIMHTGEAECIVGSRYVHTNAVEEWDA